MNDALAILRTIERTIKERKTADPSTSYVAKRFAKGVPKIAQKIGEEGVELALALVLNDKAEIVNESADLLFHIMIGLESAGVTLDQVMEEMARREGKSGIMEKKNRASSI
jgi:phosphoribosyl-ATP pyrophosphohydrolase